MRVLLANYRAGAKVAINSLGAAGMVAGYAREVFDRHCALKSTLLSAEEISRLRPVIYRAMAREANGPLLLKIHDCWHLTDMGEPVFPPQVTGGVIYVVRNVLDIASSAAHHWGVGSQEAAARLCDPAYVLGGGMQRGEPGLQQPLGSWTGHVQSWCDRSGLNLHVVRYEDLIADTSAALAAVLGFMGEPVDPVRLDHAVRNAGFADLKAQEQLGGFHEHSPWARGSFFRGGRAGAWREELPCELVRRLVDAHGDTMRRFGYLDEEGYPES